MSSVTLTNIAVSYLRSKTSSLRINELKVADGEILAVVGVSGSGKSTLLRTVAGFIRRASDANGQLNWLSKLAAPNEIACLKGKVLFDDKDVTPLSPRLRQVAIAAQALNLYPHMNARSNLAFPLRMSGLSESEIIRRVQEIARRLQIEGLLERRPGELSGGEQQRVALGKALIQDAKVYLFDEPLSSIDAPLRASFRKELRLWLREPSRTTFYVTHDLDEAFAIADRVAVIHQGSLLQVDSPQELYKSPNSLEVARLVWGGRATILAADLEYKDGNGWLRVGSKLFKFGLTRHLNNNSKVWIAAPREAFSLATKQDDSSSLLAGEVADIRFAATSYIVGVKGPGFSVEIATNGAEPPSLGNRVEVALNPKYVCLFDRDTQDADSSLQSTVNGA
jgi:ABC-type sugar transport system ATPase subunit